MARPVSLHPDFVIALRVLDGTGMPYAEALRQLIPVARRLGTPRPSYSAVRRFLIEERRRKALRTELLERVLIDLAGGTVPRDLRNVFWNTSSLDEQAGLGPERAGQ
jgi:hypothetical protein